MRIPCTVSRDVFFDHLVPPQLADRMEHELLEWASGDVCETVEYLPDSLGRVDSESSPRPGFSE